MIFIGDQNKQFSNRFYRWLYLFGKHFFVDFTFSVNLMETIRWKWHALRSIHMHCVWSQTDDWLPNFTNISLVSPNERTQSSGTANQPPATANRHNTDREYCTRANAARISSSKLLLANRVRHPKCVLSAANGWSGATNEMAFIVYAHSNFLLNKCMSLWQTLRILYSEEPNQRLWSLWLHAYVCVCEYIHYAPRYTQTQARYHSLSALTLRIIRLPHSMQSWMHANEQRNSNEHFILISHVFLHATNLSFVWHEVRAIGCSEWRYKWQGKFIWPTCALRKYQCGWVLRMNVFWTKWTKWEAVAGVIARKVPMQKRFYSFSKRGTKPWVLCRIKLCKRKWRKPFKARFESMLFGMKQQNREIDFLL